MIYFDEDDTLIIKSKFGNFFIRSDLERVIVEENLDGTFNIFIIPVEKNENKSYID